MIQFSDYVGVEVEPVRRETDAQGMDWFERCEPDSPELHCWAVYLRSVEGPALCVADCGSRELAGFVAESLRMMLAKPPGPVHNSDTGQ